MGANWADVVDGLALDGVGERFGPKLTDDCTTADSRMWWYETGVSVKLDPDLAIYGFLLKQEDVSNRGPHAGWAIDLLGSGLGWGSLATEIEAAFPDSNRDLLAGTMYIRTGGATEFLQLYFRDPDPSPSDISPTDDAYLSSVRGGDFCSLGGSSSGGRD